MKGLILTEFMDRVERQWSLDMVDKIIERSGVASEGAYTSVGDYPAEEFTALLDALSLETGMSSAQLAQDYGHELFERFVQRYPRFFKDSKDCFSFLIGMEAIIHADLRKLYPDADMPSFEVELMPGKLLLSYFSSQPFPELVHGLIQGCIAHYGQPIRLTRDTEQDPAGADARFILLAGEAT